MAGDRPNPIRSRTPPSACGFDVANSMNSMPSMPEEVVRLRDRFAIQ
jgi:hypothetical protein